MGANNDPYGDYDEDASTYSATEPTEEDRVESSYAEESETWRWGWGVLPFYSADGDAYRDEAVGDGTHGAYGEDDGSWFDEGLVSLLLIAGVVLFVIPEPATTTLGIVLILLGVGLWIADSLW